MKSENAVKNRPQSDILQVAGRLFLICLVAAVALGLVNAVTAPVIQQGKIEALQQALSGLMREGERAGEAVTEPAGGPVRVYYPVLRGGRTTGYILELWGSGYGGEMKILARYAASGEVEQVRMMDNQETPGLGKKAENPSYMDKFIGAGSQQKPLPVRKDMLSRQDAEAVTGATLTFVGVARALQEGSRYVQERLQ